MCLGTKLPRSAGTLPPSLTSAPFPSHAPDVGGRLLLPGVCGGVLRGGHLRVRLHPRDQEQDVRGDQPHVLQEGGGPRDAGAGGARTRGHAPAAQDERRLRHAGERLSGAGQLQLGPLTGRDPTPAPPEGPEGGRRRAGAGVFVPGGDATFRRSEPSSWGLFSVRI